MEKVDELKLEYILSMLKNLDFGSLNITVHNGEITQIDTTEKKRFPLKKAAK
jgi:hypothetical protein